MSGIDIFGVNISGAQYGAGGSRGINYDYIYPTHAEIDYFAAKGLTAIRLPFLLERVQPVMGGPLSASELSYIDDVVHYASGKGMDVILDPHDFGYAFGSQIGSSAFPNSAFANFWGQLAAHFSTNANVLFGLMNEPHDISAAQWLGSVNAAIAAIRASGATSQQILVPGTYWDSAATWTSSNNATVIGNGVVDPSHNFAFEVHQYLDTWGSGTQSDVVSATIGAERLAAVTAWAQATGNKLFLGEFGVSSDAVSLQALNNMLSFMKQHSDVWEGGTYWAAGAWWGPYMYSVEPTNGADKTQMAILDQYAPSNGSSTSISIVELNDSFYIDGNLGPQLKYGGSAVVAGEFGAMTPVAAASTAIGYQVAWKVTGTDQYEVWNIDHNGNYVSDTGLVSPTSNVLEALETSFHHDLNGDGIIGFASHLIESAGSTPLTQVASNFYLSAGLSLKYGGVAVAAGQFGTMVPIGAEQSSGGYEVAWKVPGADTFTIWSTDGNGNYISSTSMSGSSVETLEPSFHQDLNGDGLLGTPHSVRMRGGSTTPFQVGNNFDSTSTVSGSELNRAVPNHEVGQIGGRTHVQAEQAVRGYEVTWKLTSADHSGDWNSYDKGKYISNLGAEALRTRSVMEAPDTDFHHFLHAQSIEVNPRVSLAEAGSPLIVGTGSGDRFVFSAWQQPYVDSYTAPITIHSSNTDSGYMQITTEIDPYVSATQNSVGLSEFHLMLKMNDFLIH